MIEEFHSSEVAEGPTLSPRGRGRTKGDRDGPRGPRGDTGSLGTLALAAKDLGPTPLYIRLGQAVRSRLQADVAVTLIP